MGWKIQGIIKKERKKCHCAESNVWCSLRVIYVLHVQPTTYVWTAHQGLLISPRKCPDDLSGLGWSFVLSVRMASGIGQIFRPNLSGWRSRLVTYIRGSCYSLQLLMTKPRLSCGLDSQKEIILRSQYSEELGLSGHMKYALWDKSNHCLFFGTRIWAANSIIVWEMTSVTSCDWNHLCQVTKTGLCSTSPFINFGGQKSLLIALCEVRSTRFFLGIPSNPRAEITLLPN
jgi:hypothetical protein